MDTGLFRYERTTLYEEIPSASIRGSEYLEDFKVHLQFAAGDRAGMRGLAAGATLRWQARVSATSVNKVIGPNQYNCRKTVPFCSICCLFDSKFQLFQVAPGSFVFMQHRLYSWICVLNSSNIYQ
jgi:hypothetical protein